MQSSDHYAVLGLDRKCTLSEIRAAYRRLSKQHHPDLNPDLPEGADRARELNEAHETLSDPERRRAYDRERTEHGHPTSRERTGRNIAQDVNLRVEDFIRGVSLQVRVNDPANPNGPEIYALEVPEGTAPGARFRLARGEPFEGGFVLVRVKALAGYRFKVRGSDLRCDLRISAQRAEKGGTEMIPGATGRLVRVFIPEGIARGAIVKIFGEGLPTPRGGRGDLLVRISYRPEVRISRAKEGDPAVRSSRMLQGRRF